MDKRISTLLWPSALALALSLSAPSDGEGPSSPQRGSATLTLDQLIQGMGALHDTFDPSRASYVVRFHEDIEGFDSAGKVDAAQASWLDVEYARKGKMS